MINKALIFDSSSIITLSLNNLLYILPKLRKIFKGKFLVTQDIKKEVVDDPLNIKRFELEALKLDSFLKKGILEIAENIFPKLDLKKETFNILDRANHIYKSNGKFIKILGAGEGSCLAISNFLDKENIENILIIDERTARMLCENPSNLKYLLKSKLHKNVQVNRENTKIFRNKKIIRSSELIYLAYKKNLIEIDNGRRLIDALLYAAKYKGCSISEREIEQVKDIIG